MGFNARSVSYELLIPILVTAQPLVVNSVTMCPSGLQHPAAVGWECLLASVPATGLPKTKPPQGLCHGVGLGSQIQLGLSKVQ